MKVKVSYTTEYEKVPKLVQRILDDCCSRFSSHSKVEFNINRLEEFVASVRSIQEDLSLASDQLDDCINLSVGYVNFGNKEDKGPPEFSVVEEAAQQELPDEER